MTDAIFLVIGILMLGGLTVLAGSLSRDDPLRRRWDTRSETEARRLKRTDATGVLICRRCGTSGSEKAGFCPKCRAML